MEFKLRRTRNPIRADRYVGIAGEPLLDITNRTMLVCTGNGPKSKMTNGGGFIKSPTITSIPSTFPSSKTEAISVGISFSSILFAALSTTPYVRLVFVHPRGHASDQIVGYVKPTVSSSGTGTMSLSFTESNIKWYDNEGNLDTNFTLESATVYAQFVFPDGGVSQIDYQKDAGSKVAGYGYTPEGMVSIPNIDPAFTMRNEAAPSGAKLLDIIKYGSTLGGVIQYANGDTSIAGNTFTGAVEDYYLYAGRDICYSVGTDLYVSFDNSTHKSYDIPTLLANAPVDTAFTFTAVGDYIYAFPASGPSAAVGSLDTTTANTELVFADTFADSSLTIPKAYNSTSGSSEVYFPYVSQDQPTNLEVLKVSDGLVTSETISMNGGRPVNLYGITTCYYFNNGIDTRYGVLGYLDVNLTKPAVWTVNIIGEGRMVTLPEKIENFQPGEDYDVLQNIKAISPNLHFLIDGYNQLIGFETGGAVTRSVVIDLKDVVEFDGAHLTIDALGSPFIYGISGVDARYITSNYIGTLNY